MRAWKKTVVYRSRDKDDWLKAQDLLSKEDVEHWPFAAEEAPMAGCGIKIHPGKFWSSKNVPSVIYRIEVAVEEKERADSVLAGKVQPVRSYGFTAI